MSWIWPLLITSTPAALQASSTGTSVAGLNFCNGLVSVLFFLSLCSLFSIQLPKWDLNNKSYHVTPYTRPSRRFHHTQDKIQTPYNGPGALWDLASSSSSTRSLPLCAPAPLVFLVFHAHTKPFHASCHCPCCSYCLESLFPRASHHLLQISESSFLTTCSKIISPFPLVILLCLIFLQNTYSCPTLLHIFICYIALLPWNVNFNKAGTLVLSRWVLNKYLLNLCNIWMCVIVIFVCRYICYMDRYLQECLCVELWE